MGKFRSTGGEAVEAGTYYNFETGKKVKLEKLGLLPGTPSQSYYKVHPLLMLAGAAVGLHLFMYVIPKYLTQLYSAYAGNLVTAYVISDFILVAVALTGLFIAGFGDVFGRVWRRIPTFDWMPGKSYIAVPVEEQEDTDEK
jgi:hypothetical protein